MSFIGQHLVEGAWKGFVHKIDDFAAFLDDQVLDEQTRQTYQRITSSALKALTGLINKSKRHFSSRQFSKDVQQISSSILSGIGSAAGKYFIGSKKSSRYQKKQPANPLLGFITQAQTIFSDISIIAQQEMKKKFLSFFSDWIINGLDIALTSFKSEHTQYKILKNKIESAKQEMLTACKGGDFKAILTALKNISKAVENAPLYFNGIPLFSTSKTEDSGLLKGITNAKALKDLAKTQSFKEKETINTIQSQLQSLAKNLAIQNTFNVIFKHILNEDKASFEDIFDQPRLHVAIKQFHILIQSSSKSTVKKWLAHMSVSIVIHFFYYILDYAFEQLEKKIDVFINTKLDETLNFSKIASLFAKLNAAHLTIKDSNDYFGTIDEIVVKNMEKHQAEPSCQLYEKVQTKFLNQFSLKLPITKIFWKKISHLKLYNPVLNFLIFPLKFALCIFSWLILIIPEQLLNFVLSYTLKISFFWKKTLPTLILKALTSFSDYTRSIHPINVMMVDHLQKIWDQLKSSYIAQENGPDATKKLSPETKQSLDLTLRHLFELLEKTSFNTPEQLIHYLEGHSPIENTKIIASRFFLSQNLSAFTTMIAQTLKVAMSKESKEKLITQALISLNQGFSKKQTLTTQQMIETEEKINIMLSQILSLTIRKTIETRYNFTPKNQIIITDRFLNEIKNCALKYCFQWLQSLNSLSIKDDMSIINQVHLFCEFIQNKQLEIRSNQELSKNPRALINQWYCEPIQEKIALITHAIENLIFLKQLFTNSRFLIEELEKISTTQVHFSLKETLAFQKQGWLAHGALSPAHPLYIDFQLFYKTLEQHILNQTIKNALEELLECTDPCEVSAKLAPIIPSSAPSTTIFNLLSAFQLKISNLSSSDLKDELANLNKQIKNCIQLSQIAICQNAAQFIKKLTANKITPIFAQNSQDLSWVKAKLQLKTHIEELQKLCANFKSIEHYNIKLISTGDALELMQNFAYSSIIGPMEQLLTLIKKPYIWQYGIVNPLCKEFLE